MARVRFRNYNVGMSDDDLRSLIERARRVQMTPDEIERQRRSFAYGNVAIENPRVTREIVNSIADEAARTKKG